MITEIKEDIENFFNPKKIGNDIIKENTDSKFLIGDKVFYIKYSIDKNNNGRMEIYFGEIIGMNIHIKDTFVYYSYLLQIGLEFIEVNSKDIIPECDIDSIQNKIKNTFNIR